MGWVWLGASMCDQRARVATTTFPIIPRRNETLRRQFERLDGQVNLLAQDYRMLAATLRELWS